MRERKRILTVPGKRKRRRIDVTGSQKDHMDHTIDHNESQENIGNYREIKENI